MAEKYRIPNFRKMYPEASDEVIAVLRKSERQMQYQEYDIKTEVVRVSQRKKTVTYIPSRRTHWSVYARTTGSLLPISPL